MQDSGSVRELLEQQLVTYWAARYVGFQQGHDDDSGFLAEFRLSAAAADDTALPLPVREAYQYYVQHVEQPDWGSVDLYQLTLAGNTIFAVLVTTDGDDGWIELYDADGNELGIGRRYLELVAWGNRDMIRSQTETGAFPPSLDDRAIRTLWQQ